MSTSTDHGDGAVGVFFVDQDVGRRDKTYADDVLLSAGDGRSVSNAQEPSGRQNESALVAVPVGCIFQTQTTATPAPGCIFQTHTTATPLVAFSGQRE